MMFYEMLFVATDLVVNGLSRVQFKQISWFIMFLLSIRLIYLEVYINAPKLIIIPAALYHFYLEKWFGSKKNEDE
ncbi:MAG: hypothetical protein Q4C49_12755 [Bacillota bacterium]|nr:hypothetical protein [Bacillota bacterium]